MNVTAGFPQTGQAAHDVYVRTLKELQMKATHIWLLLIAAYGVVNANAKWKSQYDEAIFQYNCFCLNLYPNCSTRRKMENYYQL